MMDAPLDDRTLRRIIATLVALAVLAERVAGRSFPVRWFVLSLLRFAESVAQTFVAEATQSTVPTPAEEPEAGCVPLDAVELGLRFRLLAATLAALLPSPARCGRRTSPSERSSLWLASGHRGCAAAPGGRAGWPPDTS